MTKLENIYGNIKEMEAELCECLKHARALSLAVAEYESYSTSIRHGLADLKQSLNDYVEERNTQQQTPQNLAEMKEQFPKKNGNGFKQNPDKTLIMDGGSVVETIDHKGETNAIEECPFN